MNNSNESTFEALANAAISYIFPNYVELDIKHQEIFSVRIGHHVEEVRPNLKKPRLDILVSCKGKPLAVLELKRPGRPITDEDRLQGLSYARLSTPMPPLVIVSNGTSTTQFYNTYTGDEITVKTQEEAEIQKLFSNALSLAAENQDIAIRTLLGKDPVIWKKLISELSDKGFENHTGSIDSLQDPIAHNFLLPRKATQKVIDLLCSDNPLIAVTGAPLSGKTNILYEFCQLHDQTVVPLYINVADCRYGILQYIANHFSRYFSSATSQEDVRIWLMRGIIGRPHVAGKLIIIIDGVRHSNHSIRSEIDELIDICERGAYCALVVATDTTSYREMSQISGRGEKTLFGKRVKQVDVKTLDDDEFTDAKKYIFEKFKALFNVGSNYSKELRSPRILRMVTSVSSTTSLGEDHALYLPTFITFNQLDSIIEEFRGDPQFIEDMSMFVKCYLEHERSTPYETLISYGHGHIPYALAVDMLGEERIARLQVQGHIDWYEGQDSNRYFLPKVPELFAATAIYYLVGMARQLAFPKSLNTILYLSETLPYGDLVAANTIYKLTLTESIPLYDVLVKLLNSPPKRELLKVTFDAVSYFEDIGFFKLPDHVLENHREESTVIENSFPWLVLSQLAMVPMESEGTESPWDMRLTIMGAVGSYPDILKRFEPSSFEDWKGFYHHTINSADGQVGNVLCGQHGIVEPITFAIQQGFYEKPTEMLRLCKRAVSLGNSFLAHRIYNAVNTVRDSTDETVAKVACRAHVLLEDTVRHV
jgi:hypothetical protein